MTAILLVWRVAEERACAMAIAVVVATAASGADATLRNATAVRGGGLRWGREGLGSASGHMRDQDPDR